MRRGILVDELGTGFDVMIEQARTAADLGYRTIWLAERGGWDALTSLAVLGAAVPGIELGTAIVPTYPRHPLTLAAQALTVQAATGSRLHLGVGVHHRHGIEGRYGYSFDRPVRHLREYLQALNPVLRGEKADFHGETLTAVGEVTAPGVTPPSVLVGAVSPQTMRVTGAHADGVITAWAGPRGLADFAVPTLTEAAAAPPRVITAQLICVTSDVDSRRAWVEERYGLAATLPAYRAVLDRDGFERVGDSVLAGDEETVLRKVQELEDAGATELLVMPFGSPEEQSRTRQLLAA